MQNEYSQRRSIVCTIDNDVRRSQQNQCSTVLGQSKNFF